MRRIACLVGALAVTACADLSQQNSDLAFLARGVIVGQSRAQVLACAGKPQREEVNGEAETLTYFASSGERTLVIGSANGIANVPHSCEVTLVLRRGYVEDVRYAGRTGGLLTPDEECAVIVRKCMRPR